MREAMLVVPARAPVAAALAAEKTSPHPGLVHARYCGAWTEAGGALQIDGKSIKRWLEKFVVEFSACEAGKKLHARAMCRRKKSLAALAKAPGHNVETFDATTIWRLTIGLGLAHPSGNGFLFHHVYGVPYLPGSSLKGVARAWAKQNGVDQDDIARVLGPEVNDERPARGAVVFWDAFPIEWPTLEDGGVLTPHQKPYYERGAQPADWNDPEPSYFLTIRAGEPFSFAVDAPKKEDAELARDWLQGGFEELGVGGKTGAGYGYFYPEQS